MKEEKTNPSFPIPKDTPKSVIEDFLSSPKNLSLLAVDEDEKITLLQSHDNKTLSFYESDVDRVLRRKDVGGEVFLQVNFTNGKKILLTDEFIGFSPAVCSNMDIKRLPKVVTTVDLLSVIEALESSLYGTDYYQESLHDVKLFFEAIASGAEAIGFSLTGERLWVAKLFPQ